MNRQQHRMDTDVLIVGAGPTGLMLANQLGRRGVRTMIIDRHGGPAQQSRAMAVHARTLEIYAKLGVAQRAVELGQRGAGANIWMAGLLRTRIVPRLAATAMTLERVRKLAFRTLSQTGIHYPDSSLSKTLDGLPEGAPRGGDRFPWLRLKFRADGPVEDLFEQLDDTRFTLLVIGQPAPAEAAMNFGDLLRIHVIPVDPVNEAELTRAHISRPSFYLLRPDGHVGLCGVRPETAAVASYVSERLGLRNLAGGEVTTTTPAGAEAGTNTGQEWLFTQPVIYFNGQ